MNFVVIEWYHRAVFKVYGPFETEIKANAYIETQRLKGFVDMTVHSLSQNKE